MPFHGPEPFHGGYGGYHGGWGVPVNPWNFVAPLVVDYATQPRYVVNPVTGQQELRGPGRWVTNADGSILYMPLPAWPLLGHIT